MAIDYKEKVKNLLNPRSSQNAEIQRKVNNFYTNNTYNPFLDRSGELKNKSLNYSSMMNNSKISGKVKNFISQATGIAPAQTAERTATAPTVAVNAYTPPQTSNVQTTQTGKVSDSNIVNAAKKYIGTPYVWGGESMSEGGMDCSGFVYNALKDAGYQVGRTTAQGYRSYGNSVSKSEMQPGDLVFYGSGNKASHIGIYIGDGQIIQSSGGKSNTKTNPGKGVSIKNIDYRDDFLEARRY